MFSAAPMSGASSPSSPETMGVDVMRWLFMAGNPSVNLNFGYNLGDDATCVAALCDGTVGYIPTAEAFEVGGYEPNASVLVPGEGERLADALIALASGAPGA